MTMSIEQLSYYDNVKEFILKAYELISEAYRHKIRNCRKVNSQTHVYFNYLTKFFYRSCHLKKIDSNHENLRQLRCVEEFRICVNLYFQFNTMKLGQNICLYDIAKEFENGSCRVKTMSNHEKKKKKKKGKKKNLVYACVEVCAEATFQSDTYETWSKW